MNPFRGRLAIIAGSLLCALIPGCVGLLEPRPVAVQSRVPRPEASDAAASGRSLFYPLDIGNHWEYDRYSRIQVIPNDGPANPPVVHLNDQLVDLTGTQERYGREYVVQHESIREGGVAFDSDYLYRQDEGGLFSADPPSGTALATGRNDAVTSAARERIVRDATVGLGAPYRAAAARVLEKQRMIRDLALHGAKSSSGTPLMAKASPAGPLAGEIAVLVYPLGPHATWHVREDPLVIFTVEGHETLKLPAGNFHGFRIRIDWPNLFGPEDRVHVWYGRDGYLQLESHVTGDAVDENGNVIGMVISDETLKLRGLSLVNGKSQTP